MERRQPQEVFAVALIIQMLDVRDAVSFFRCMFNVKLLSRITPSRQSVVLTLIANKDSRIPGAVVWPSRAGAYLTFVSVQV